MRDLGRASYEIQQAGSPDTGRIQRGGKDAVVFAFVVVLVAIGLALALLGNVLAGTTMLVLALAVATVANAFVIVDAYEQGALTVFGEYRGLLDPGIHVIPPFVSTVHRFDLRTQTMDVPRQDAITRDNSPVTANAVVYLRVTNPERAFLEVDNYGLATRNLAQTTLRAVIGDMDLDDTLSERGIINERIRKELDEPTDAWGIRVESVEVSEVLPSPAVTDAMEEQTAAERKRRAMILEAQGERQSAIERAEGDKTAAILRAQGTKDAAVLEAQGDAVATVLRARAAESMGERAVIEKGLETLADIGTSPSTTYVLPQELSSLLGRYSRTLTGSDVATGGAELESLVIDDETREWLGVDSIEDITSMSEGDAVAVEVEPTDEE
jgi:regulator of protease activity HflC (stomatin/prohibitin superfamily)